jgi:hypothetical protein
MALRRKWLTTMAKTAKVSFYIVETTWDWARGDTAGAA